MSKKVKQVKKYLQKFTGKIKNKSDKALVGSIIVVVFFMSMCYSILNRNLNISGDLTYRPNLDMRITNVTYKTSTDGNPAVQYLDFSRKEISFGYVSSAEGTITLTVEVTNYSLDPAGILSIDNLPEDAVIEGYEIGTKLKADNGESGVGMIKTFTITFKAKASETKSYLLKFNFVPVLKVTYDKEFKQTTGFKTEVLKGATFTQDIGVNSPITNGSEKTKNTTPELIVKMGSVRLEEGYTYENGVLTIPNVTGNLEIDLLSASYLGFDPTKTGLTQCSNVQCAIDEINKIIDKM